MLMRYAGSLLFVVTLVPFLIWAWQASSVRIWKPAVAVGVSLLLLYLSINMLVPPFRDSSPNELWRVGSVEVSGELLRVVLMAICFVVVGSVIGSIGWLIASAGAVSQRSKSLIPLLVTGGVALLMGLTRLPATMVPMPILLMIGLAGLASTFLNQTVYGRYLFALGRNEEAARYSGINTKQMIVLSYVLCALAAGLGGILFALDINSVQPSSFGNFYELYAIAAAVLWGMQFAWRRRKHPWCCNRCGGHARSFQRD